MTQVILPNRNVTGDNLWSQVETNDDAIATVVNGQIQNDNVAAGADISGSKLAAASLPLDRLAAPVSNAYIADGAVTTAKIGDGQVTTAKIGDGQVTAAKIGYGQVTPDKLSVGIPTVKTVRAGVTRSGGGMTDFTQVYWPSAWGGPNAYNAVVSAYDPNGTGAWATVFGQEAAYIYIKWAITSYGTFYLNVVGVGI